jgi:hypothetical protein
MMSFPSCQTAAASMFPTYYPSAAGPLYSASMAAAAAATSAGGGGVGLDTAHMGGKVEGL